MMTENPNVSDRQPTRVLVCGDRNWNDTFAIWTFLDGFLYRPEGVVLIEGCARGADSIAGEWAMVRLDTEAQHLRFPAKWDEHGKRAGPIRNQQMLTEGKPEVVIAFHDDIASSKGTGDMVKRAVKAGLPTYVVSRARTGEGTSPPREQL